MTPCDHGCPKKRQTCREAGIVAGEGQSATKKTEKKNEKKAFHAFLETSYSTLTKMGDILSDCIHTLSSSNILIRQYNY